MNNYKSMNVTLAAMMSLPSSKTEGGAHSSQEGSPLQSYPLSNRMRQPSLIPHPKDSRESFLSPLFKTPEES